MTQSPTPDAPEPGRAPDAAETALQASLQHALAQAVAWFRTHLLVFLILNGALAALNAWTGKPWWAIWPLLATAALLGVHYLVYKAMTADESWAEERAQELNLKSYDRGHIQDISDRAGLSTPVDRALRRPKSPPKPPRAPGADA